MGNLKRQNVCEQFPSIELPWQGTSRFGNWAFSSSSHPRPTTDQVGENRSNGVAAVLQEFRVLSLSFVIRSINNKMYSSLSFLFSPTLLRSSQEASEQFSVHGCRRRRLERSSCFSDSEIAQRQGGLFILYLNSIVNLFVIFFSLLDFDHVTVWKPINTQVTVLILMNISIGAFRNFV